MSKSSTWQEAQKDFENLSVPQASSENWKKGLVIDYYPTPESLKGNSALNTALLERLAQKIEAIQSTLAKLDLSKIAKTDKLEEVLSEVKKTASGSQAIVTQGSNTQGQYSSPPKKGIKRKYQP